MVDSAVGLVIPGNMVTAVLEDFGLAVLSGAEWVGLGCCVLRYGCNVGWSRGLDKDATTRPTRPFSNGVSLLGVPGRCWLGRISSTISSIGSSSASAGGIALDPGAARSIMSMGSAELDLRVLPDAEFFRVKS